MFASYGDRRKGDYMAVRASNQTVGNVGMYYACYRLSQLGWNVMPTVRNAKGIDILAYSQDGSRTETFQVKPIFDSLKNEIFIP
jgi:hypothetical protein